MEYQSQDEHGQVQWYNLVGDTAIPEKVSVRALRFKGKN